MLLEHGACVNEKEYGGYLENPAHAAVHSADFEILKMVLKKGPKLDCVDLL
jgi:hypothetical protein